MQLEQTSSIRPESSASQPNKHTTADDWQAHIQSNYEEFVAAKAEVLEDEKLNVTMEDVNDSDEDLPSYCT